MKGGKSGLDTHWTNHWLFREYSLTAQGLAAFRIVYVLFVVFIFGLPEFGWIAQFPGAFYDPRLFSIAIFFSDFPSALFLNGLSIICAILFAMLLFGWQTRWVSFLLPLLIFTGKSFAYSFGKIDHDILLWIVPWLMAPAGWGAIWSLDHRMGKTQKVRTWPVTLMVFIVGFGMFTAALPKAMGGWLDFSTQAVKSHLAYNYYVVGRQELLSGWFLGLESRAFWEFMDWSAILFEFGLFVSLLRKSWLRWFILITLVFHVANLLMLNIAFKANLMAYMLVFTWPWLLARIHKSRLSKWMTPLLRPGNMVACTALFVLLIVFTEGPLLYLLPPLIGMDILWLDTIVLVSALLMAIGDGLWAGSLRPTSSRDVQPS